METVKIVSVNKTEPFIIATMHDFVGTFGFVKNIEKVDLKETSIESLNIKISK